MTRIDEIRRRFAYDEWCHRRMLDAYRTFGGEATRSLKQFAHVLASNKVWQMRLEGRDSNGQDLWPTLDLEACASLLEETSQRRTRWLEAFDEDDLDRPLRYTNQRGETHDTPRGEILQHLALHAAYHRGQAMQAFIAAGGAPVNTDFITYVRENPA